MVRVHTSRATSTTNPYPYLLWGNLISNSHYLAGDEGIFIWLNSDISHQFSSVFLLLSHCRDLKYFPAFRHKGTYLKCSCFKTPPVFLCHSSLKNQLHFKSKMTHQMCKAYTSGSLFGALKSAEVKSQPNLYTVQKPGFRVSNNSISSRRLETSEVLSSQCW